MSSNLFNKLGVVTVNSGMPSNLNLIHKVDMYLKRFPEIEYLIDMLASSIIYTSSSNTKKMQIILNGEHTVIKKTPTVKQDTTSSDTTTVGETNDPTVDIDSSILETNVEKVDSYYKDLNIKIGNLFKKNNIKLSLYNVMNSILKYGFGIFYFDNMVNYDSVTFYGLDEVKFIMNDKNETFDTDTDVS